MGEDLLVRLEEERKVLYNYAKKMYIISGSIALLGLILLLVGFINFIIPLFIIGGLLLFASVLTFALMNSSPKYRARKKQMKSDIVNWYLADKGYENFNYQVDGGLSYESFYKLGLIKEIPDVQNYEDLIQGEYKNVKFSMSDLHLQRKETRVDSKGHSSTTYVTYFKGKAIIIDYPKILDCDVTLLDRTDMLFCGHNGNKLETEVIEFNKKFNIYTSDKGTVFKILSPHMIMKILEFKKMQKGKMSLSFTRDKLYIVINNNSDMANINWGKEISKEMLERYLGDFLLPAAIINEFRLDTHLYQD